MLAGRQLEARTVDGYFHSVFPDPAPASAERMVGVAFPERELFDAAEVRWKARLLKATQDWAECTRLMDEGSGMDIPGVCGTAWAALNAVTEYVDHLCGQAQSPERSMRRRLYGSGADVKRRAYREALALLKP